MNKFKKTLLTGMAVVMSLGGAGLLTACNGKGDAKISTPQYTQLSLAQVYKEKETASYSASKIDAGENFSLANVSYKNSWDSVSGMLVFENTSESLGDDDIKYKYYSTETNSVILEVPNKDTTSNFGVKAIVVADDDEYLVVGLVEKTYTDGVFTYKLIDKYGNLLSSYSSSEIDSDYNTTSVFDCYYYYSVNSFISFNGKVYKYNIETKALIRTDNSFTSDYLIDKSVGSSNFNGNYYVYTYNNFLMIYSVTEGAKGDLVRELSFSQYDEFCYYLLQNGNIFIQTYENDSENYNVKYKTAKYNISQYIYDVATNSFKEISVNFYVESGNLDFYSNVAGGADEEVYQDSIQNVINVKLIENGVCDDSIENTRTIALNNDGSVLGQLPYTITEGVYEILKPVDSTHLIDDDYNLYNSDYEVIGYIEGTNYNDKYVVLADSIYDFDLNKVYTLGNDESIVALTDCGVVLTNLKDEYYLYNGTKTQIGDKSTVSELSTTQSGLNSIDEYATYKYYIKYENNALSVCDYNGNTIKSFESDVSSYKIIVNNVFEVTYGDTTEYYIVK